MGSLCCKEEEVDFSAEVQLGHFQLLRSVGKGAFGKVRIVEHKGNKRIYALKYINKAKCIQMKAVENILQERHLLEAIDCRLICNLRYAFQDDENMFMVLDLMLGGDLRFHLDRQCTMKEDVVKFLVAEVGTALNYLHQRNIVHRDLKPDNILLDEKGHCHLTDFNIAVNFSPNKPLTSFSGSMAYMAPEVFAKKGYFATVDWWSLGVVAYELLFGKRPFRGKTNDALTQSILNNTPAWQKDKVSADCIDCVQKLLTRDIKSRLGCDSEGFEGFKNHPWFQGIEWSKLLDKTAIPPFAPDSKQANFEATHELEELLLEDNPLKVKKRAVPKNGEVVKRSVEMQTMEDKFTVFDYTKPKLKNNPEEIIVYQDLAAIDRSAENEPNEPDTCPTTSDANMLASTGTHLLNESRLVDQECTDASVEGISSLKWKQPDC